MKLICDDVATDEGVDNLMCRRLETRRKVEMVTLGDGVLHCEHIMQCVGPLDAEKWVISNVEEMKRGNGPTEVFPC